MNKYLKPVIALGLVATLAIGGTLAYLTDTTGDMENKFTPDKDLDIYLTETEREYKLIPGGKSDKDPSVEVKPESADSYVFIEVTEKILTDALDANNKDSDSFEDYVGYNITTEWTQVGEAVSSSEGEYTVKKYVYAYTEDATLASLVTVAGNAGDSLKILVGDEVTYPTTVTQEMIKSLNKTVPSLTFKAYAIQSENIEAQTDTSVTYAEYVYGLVKDSEVYGETDKLK